MRLLRGLALQVGNLVGLRVGAPLVARELLLGLAFALLLASLSVQGAVAGEVAGGLLARPVILSMRLIVGAPIVRWSSWVGASHVRGYPTAV